MLGIYDLKKLNFKLTFLSGFDTSGKNTQGRFRNSRNLTGIKIQKSKYSGKHSFKKINLSDVQV